MLGIFFFEFLGVADVLGVSRAYHDDFGHEDEGVLDFYILVFVKFDNIIRHNEAQVEEVEYGQQFFSVVFGKPVTVMGLGSPSWSTFFLLTQRIVETLQ